MVFPDLDEEYKLHDSIYQYAQRENGQLGRCVQPFLSPGYHVFIWSIHVYRGMDKVESISAFSSCFQMH